jgi:hypothetical protein
VLPNNDSDDTFAVAVAVVDAVVVDTVVVVRLVLV